ncbi:MAG: hypothetical protein KGL35_31720 [Bradyrhizobium sp.]|nr:hypothetical protein [Bradyrhizobium sp.]
MIDPLEETQRAYVKVQPGVSYGLADWADAFAVILRNLPDLMNEIREGRAKAATEATSDTR